MSIARYLPIAAMFSATLPVAGASAAPVDPLAVLAGLESGRWEIRADGEPARAMCLADTAQLLQVRHGAAACSRLVIASDKQSATVHYSCPGAGWGRTTLRASTPRSVKIETQGIAENAPFAYSLEAKKTGECGALAAMAPGGRR